MYDKRDDFNFNITNIPFRCSNIPSTPACCIFVSQIIRYVRNCSSYECLILTARRLSAKLPKEGYLLERLKLSLRKFYVRYGDLIQHYEVSLSRMLNDIRPLTNYSDFPTDQTFHTFHDLDTKFDLHRITSGFHGALVTGVACQQGTLALPDTWFRLPFRNPLCSNLSLISRFCFY